MKRWIADHDIAVRLAILALIMGLITLSLVLWGDTDPASDHPGCTKVEIHLQRDYGYYWLCPTPTEGK